MSVQSIGPFSNFKTNNNTSKSTVTNSQAVQNVAQEAGKISKKTAIIGGVAALAVAGTVAVVAIKRHKVPDEIKTALNNFKATNEAASSLIESAQKQTDEIMESGKKLFDEVTELFKKGDEIAPDGTILRKITGDDAEKIMEEFSQDGKLFRKSTFVNDILDNVQEGFEELPDGTKKIAKGIDFLEDGKPYYYMEDFKELADGSKKIAKAIDFEDGKPHGYMEGFEQLADGSWKIEKAIDFEDGKPSLYQEDIKKLTDDTWKVAKEIGFEDGKLNSYQEDIKELADGSWKIEKAIDFEDGKPRWHQEDIKKLPDGTIEAAKEFELTNKGWKKVGE